MNCSNAQDLFSRLLDNEIRFEDREAVQAHLGTCPDCIGMFQKYRDDAVRLAAVFAPLRENHDSFAARTAAVISEREKPHDATHAADPAASSRRSSIAIPVAVSVIASAATFLVMLRLSVPSTSEKDNSLAHRSFRSPSNVSRSGQESEPRRGPGARPSDRSEFPAAADDT